MSCDAPKILCLKIGCPVILIRNLPGGLCNGLQGIVTKLEEEGPTVNFQGKLHKLEREKFQIVSRDGHDIISQRLQFPIRLAYALTVHRAQGLTIPVLAIDCFSFFKPGQLGVAVGRATTTKTLQVVNYNHEAACLKHPQVVYHFYTQESAHLSENLSCCRESSFHCQKNLADDHGDSDDTIAYSSNTELSEENSEDHSVQEQKIKKPVFEEKPIDFPWNIYTFLKETVSSDRLTPQQQNLSKLADKFQENIRLIQFLKQIYGIILHMYNAETKTKPKNWANLYSLVHHFLTSAKFMDLCKWLCGDYAINKECNKLCSRLVLHCLSKIIEEKAATVLLNEDETEEAYEPTDRKVYESKLRYIAGACIAKIKYRINTMITSKLHSPKFREIVGHLYKQQKLLSTLRITESEIMASTQNPESLSYTDFKQGASRGLTHVSDGVFDFFILLHSKITPLLSSSSINRHLDDLHAYVRRLIQCDNELEERWASLFETEKTDDDIYESLLLELFHLVTNHCVKILLADRIKQFKEQIPRTKKQALRASLHGSSKSATTGGKKFSSLTGEQKNVRKPFGSSKQVKCSQQISSSDSSDDISCQHVPISTATRSRRQVTRPARYLSDSSDEELQVSKHKGRGKKSSK